MARNDVRFVLSAEDGNAIKAATKLLEEIRKTGDATDELGTKQKRAGQGFNEVFGETIVRLGKGIASMETFAQVLDAVKEKLSAIAAEMSRTGQTSSSYMHAFSGVVSSMPGASQADLQQLEQILRSTAGARALGEQGLIKLTDAAAGIGRAPLSMAQREDVLSETGQLMESQPKADHVAMAKGMAALISASGGQLSANSAQNMLLSMQGKLGDAGKVGDVVSQLRPYAAMSGANGGELPMDQMMGLAGMVSQTIGDGDGSRTVAVVKWLWQTLMNDPAKIQERTGPLTGSLIDRINQIGNANAGGLLFTEEDVADATGLGRGPDARLFAKNVISPRGQARLAHRISAMGYAGMMGGDLAADQHALLQSVVPGADAMEQSELVRSRLSSERAGDQRMISGQATLEAMEALYARGGRTERFSGFFKQAFTALDGAPYSNEERAARAERIATEAEGLSRVPMVGGLLSKVSVAGAALEGKVGFRAGGMESAGEEIKQAIHSGFREASRRIPQRALPAGVDR